MPSKNNGSIASLSASFVGHYPWFLTYNFLNLNIEKPGNDENGKKLGVKGRKKIIDRLV